jgi:hypothetical protein
MNAQRPVVLSIMVIGRRHCIGVDTRDDGSFT